MTNIQAITARRAASAQNDAAGESVFVGGLLLEEIGMEGREIFLKAGGESFQRIPCLNDQEDWAAAMAGMISVSL